VAVKIKLMRLGKIRAPYYRIVVADARNRRSGRAIETIGKYHPKERPELHRGRLRARPVLARRRRPADRPGAQHPGDHRRLAEVQGLPGTEGTLRQPAAAGGPAGPVQRRAGRGRRRGDRRRTTAKKKSEPRPKKDAEPAKKDAEPKAEAKSESSAPGRSGQR